MTSSTLLYVYSARDGWRWRLRTRNGRIVAESGEAYRRRWWCLRVARRLARYASTARLICEPPAPHLRRPR